MTQPFLSSEDVSTLVKALISQADKLGWIWRMIPGTVRGASGLALSGTVDVELDPDNVLGTAAGAMPCLSLIGSLLDGDRVMVMWIPPKGFYVIGRPGVSSIVGRPLGGSVFRLSAQNITTGGAPQAIAWDTLERDVGDFVPAGLGTQLIIPAGLGGRYEAKMWGFFQTNVTGFRYMAILQNGNQISSFQGPTATVAVHNSISQEFTAAAGDIMTGVVQHNAGITLTWAGKYTLRYLGPA